MVFVRRAALAALAAASLAGCSAGLGLTADLRTDWVAGEEFAGVRVELFRGAGVSGAPMASRDVLATRGRSYLAGARVDEWSGLSAGDYAVRLTLLQVDGSVRAQRTTYVTVHAQTGITIVITRDCRGVACPGVGDDASWTACLGGRCVDPSCTPEHPAGCRPTACTTSGDCPATVACASAACVTGTCFVEAYDSRCRTGEWCSPDVGCTSSTVPDGGAGDGGGDASPGDAGHDSGGGPPPPPPCDCTGCGSPVPIGGTCRVPCASSPACQTCTVEVACVETSGSCRFFGEVPGTARYANASSGTSCGATTYGTWGACGGFTSLCDTTGTQSRSVTTHTCNASGSCGSATSSESRACTRVTDGNPCGGATQCCLAGVCRTGIC